ncbi:MAG: 3-isopropylmalate dehydrogenase [Nitrospinae bacterium]|nr:3-isopropylmalate dehydrogenase [Nitrospinota bacterium]
MTYPVAVLPGDGIGHEVVREAVEVLEAVGERFGLKWEFHEASVGGQAIDQMGIPLPSETLELCERSEAVLLGAVGGPKWDQLDYDIRPERALLGLRKELGLYANLRPVQLSSPLADASPLKREIIEGLDLVVVRELTGGIYYGQPKGIELLGTEERGINTLIYTTSEIERVARLAFQLAAKRRKKLTSVDKANILESSVLWRKVVIRVAQEFPQVELAHMLVDNCAMQLIRDPRQFDVILAGNMFGDILSDEAAMLTGSIGMLPSASLGGRVGLYEPVHGSAPDIAGQDLANPIATILSGAMMLRYSFNQESAAEAIERSVLRVLEAGYRTSDIYEEGKRRVGTAEMGDLIVREIEAGG